MKRFLLTMTILCFSFRLFAMDWPSPAGTTTRNFGWNDSGQPQLGVSIRDEGDFFAAEDGELLYRRREDDTASRFPSPLGSWIAIDHRDGIISIYSRYDDARLDSGLLTGTPPEAVVGQVQKGEILGKAGISGWTGSKGFYFQLFDRKERRWINPSMIIPPLEDTRPPAILSVRLRDEHEKLFDPGETRNLSQGRYFVLVDAVDTMLSPNEIPLAPYRIICSINGSEAGVLSFETYSARDGSLMVYRNGLVPVKQAYAPYPMYEAAEVWLSRGQTVLEIIAQDISGNARRVVYRLMVE